MIEHKYTNGKHYFIWESNIIKREIYTKLRAIIESSRTYEPDNIWLENNKQIADEFLQSINMGQLLAMRDSIVKNKVVQRYGTMNKHIKNVAADFYGQNTKRLSHGEVAPIRGNMDIIALAKKWDFPPLNLMRGILLTKYEAPVIFDIINAGASPTLLTPFERRQLTRATKHDTANTTNERERRGQAQDAEDAFVRFFESFDISLITQDSLAIHQIESHGRAISTPDMLFADDVYINNIQVKWIDYKDYVLTDIKFMHKSNSDQAAKYNAKWGKGALIYGRGLVEGVEIADTMILSGI